MSTLEIQKTLMVLFVFIYIALTYERITLLMPISLLHHNAPFRGKALKGNTYMQHLQLLWHSNSPDVECI